MLNVEATGNLAGAPTRRQVLAGAAVAAVAAALPQATTRAADEPPAAAAAPRKGRIKQSVVNWCFSKYWDVDKICQVSKQLGLQSVELIDPKAWPTLKKHGLVCAIASSHGFV